MVRHGQETTLVEELDYHQMAEKISNILQEPQLARRLGERAHLRAERDFHDSLVIKSGRDYLTGEG